MAQWAPLRRAALVVLTATADMAQARGRRAMAKDNPLGRAEDARTKR